MSVCDKRKLVILYGCMQQQVKPCGRHDNSRGVAAATRLHAGTNQPTPSIETRTAENGMRNYIGGILWFV